MATKATLVNDSGQKVVVDSGSQDAQNYFGQGYKLMGATPPPTQAPPAAAPNPSPAPSPTGAASGTVGGASPMGMDSFAMAMNEMRSKFSQNADLQAQKSSLLKQIGGSTLTPEEMKALSPSQINAIDNNNLNGIAQELRLVNETMQGRAQTLDTSIKYFSDTYQKSIDNLATEKQQHFDNVMKMYDTGGSAAFKNMPEDQKRAFEQTNGLPQGFLDTPSEKELANTVTLKDSSGNEFLVDKSTGRIITTTGGSSGSSGDAGIITTSDGQNFDLSNYSTTPGYGDSLTSIMTSMGQLTDSNLQTYITNTVSNSPINADMIKAASQQNGVPWEPLMAILQKESTLGTSNVASKNNNPGGITWSQSYQDSHPGVSKGSARPPGEGGNYVKFGSMGDGVNAVAEQLSNRAISSDEAQTKKSAGLSDIDAIVQGIMSGSLPPSTTGLYGKSAAVKAGLAKKGFDLNKAGLQYDATKKFLASENSATQLRMRQAEASVEQSLNGLKQISSEFDRTGFKFANKAELTAAANGTMGPEKAKQAQALEGQISLITDELGQTFMGGNSPTDAAFSLAAKVLSSDFSKDTLDSQIDLLQKNLQYRKNAWDSVGAVGGQDTSGNASTDSGFDASAAQNKYGY